MKRKENDLIILFMIILGFISMANAILNFGADVNALNDNGSAAIHVAVEKSRLLADFYRFRLIE